MNANELKRRTLALEALASAIHAKEARTRRSPQRRRLGRQYLMTYRAALRMAQAWTRAVWS